MHEGLDGNKLSWKKTSEWIGTTYNLIRGVALSLKGQFCGFIVEFHVTEGCCQQNRWIFMFKMCFLKKKKIWNNNFLVFLNFFNMHITKIIF